MVNLHYTSVFHLRRTLYSGVTSDLPDLLTYQSSKWQKCKKKKHTITLPQLLVFYITIDLLVLQVGEVKEKKNYYTVSKFLKFTCLYLRLD